MGRSSCPLANQVAPWAVLTNHTTEDLLEVLHVVARGWHTPTFALLVGTEEEASSPRLTCTELGTLATNTATGAVEAMQDKGTIIVVGVTPPR